jgi:translocator protein
MKNWIKLVISLALPQIAGITAAIFTETGEGSWYRSIEKPDWNPPGWVFAPVWTTLYILMGIAFYLIWKSNAPQYQKKWAMTLWLVQLVFNFFWTIIFFNQHQIGWALVEMIGLWLLILSTIIAFARINKLAPWLLVPYISWVSFAALLNGAIWLLN